MEELTVKFRVADDMFQLFEAYVPDWRKKCEKELRSVLIREILVQAIEAWQKKPEKINEMFEITIK